MKRVTLGKSGIEVSELCFGALTIGPLQANLALSEGADIVAYALRQGIDFFDTAQFYRTYDFLREGMRRCGRWDAVICSKTYAYTKKSAMAAVDEARRALDRDVIDIFMLHEQESALTLRGHRDALDYLYDCKARGIVRAVGVSTHHVAGVKAAAQLGVDIIHPLINKDGLGIVDAGRSDMEDAIAKAHDANIGIYAMKVFGGGNLFRDADACLNYVRGLGTIDAFAIGMQSTDEVDANIAFFRDNRFPTEALLRLKRRVRRLHIDDWCEGCGACARACGQGALHITEDGKAMCDQSKCLLCGYCSGHCPSFAIKVV